MDALQLTSAVGPGPGGRRERPTIGLLIGNRQRVGEFERDVAVSSLPLSVVRSLDGSLP